MPPYIDPIPYAHLQVVRATRKPKANGDRNGEMMNPIVQMLSYNRRVILCVAVKKKQEQTLRACKWKGNLCKFILNKGDGNSG